MTRKAVDPDTFTKIEEMLMRHLQEAKCPVDGSSPDYDTIENAYINLALFQLNLENGTAFMDENNKFCMVMNHYPEQPLIKEIILGIDDTLSMIEKRVRHLKLQC